MRGGGREKRIKGWLVGGEFSYQYLEALMSEGPRLSAECGIARNCEYSPSCLGSGVSFLTRRSGNRMRVRASSDKGPGGMFWPNLLAPSLVLFACQCARQHRLGDWPGPQIPCLVSISPFLYPVNFVATLFPLWHINFDGIYGRHLSALASCGSCTFKGILMRP